MALIPFPDIPLSRSDITPRHEGQITLESLYGSGSQTLGRGPGSWLGRLELALRDKYHDGHRRAAEGFITRLRGSLNSFEAPVLRPSAGTLAPGTVLTVTNASIANDELTVTVNGAVGGLAYGDYVRIGPRLYQLSAAHAFSRLKLEPIIAPLVADIVMWENVTCMARLDTEQPITYFWTPDFSGPWILPWIEVI